jgi:ribosomal protein S18 acetylase RimI-like enzyme
MRKGAKRKKVGWKLPRGEHDWRVGRIRGILLCTKKSNGEVRGGSCTGQVHYGGQFESDCSRYNGGVSFLIRQFEKTDFDTLWQIDQACFDPKLAYSRPELAFYMRRPGSFCSVAEGDSAILGFIVAESRRKSGHIITIDVVAKARRAGVGSALLLAAEEKLIRVGALAVALETPVNNEAAIRFYKAKGYFVEKTVAGYYSGQLDALVMTKELAPSSVG